MKSVSAEKKSNESSLVEDVDIDSTKENGNSLIDVDWKVEEQSLVQESPHMNNTKTISTAKKSIEISENNCSNFIEIKSKTQSPVDEHLMLHSNNDGRSIMSPDENRSRTKSLDRDEKPRSLIGKNKSETSLEFLDKFECRSDYKESSEDYD